MEDCVTMIRRAIVNENTFDVGIGLINDGVIAPMNVFLRIVERNNTEYFHSIKYLS